MADLQVRRQQLLVGERKRAQKQVEGLEKKKKTLEARVSEAKRKMENKRNNPSSRIKKSVESWESDLQDLGEKNASLGSKLEAAQVQLKQIKKVYEEEREEIEIENKQNHDSRLVESDREMLSGDSDIDNSDDRAFFTEIYVYTTRMITFYTGSVLASISLYF